MAGLPFNLNRKAGTTGRDAQAAANIWAGTTGLDLVGALNQKAQLNRSPADYKDLQGVLNELAGTTGLGVEKAGDLL